MGQSQVSSCLCRHQMSTHLITTPGRAGGWVEKTLACGELEAPQISDITVPPTFSQKENGRHKGL
ncbi:hypothetical protein NQZ68_013999 [Dissostichus eleginoides]|nr:hypothetical protein NQZ68_013999 [Dissostichus eleginoides]